MQQGQIQKRTYYRFLAGYHVALGGLLFLSHWLAIPYFLSSLLVVLYPIGILVLGALYRPPGRPSQWIVDSVMMFVLLAVGLGSTFILTSNMWYTFAISLTLFGCWFLVRSIITNGARIL